MAKIEKVQAQETDRTPSKVSTAVLERLMAEGRVREYEPPARSSKTARVLEFLRKNAGKPFTQRLVYEGVNGYDDKRKAWGHVQGDPDFTREPAVHQILKRLVKQGVVVQKVVELDKTSHGGNTRIVYLYPTGKE